MPGLVLPLAELADDALSLAGGKAISLGRLLRAGFPVPPGCCVSTEAYALAADHPSVRAAVDRLLAADPDQRPARSAEVRDALTTAPIPDRVAAEVAAGYAGLGPDRVVAVRSSATAEDLPYASFAGQQDTYLGIAGTEAVLDAVRRCWASLWTERAVAYRDAAGIDHRSVRLAVVVQRLLDASVAGVIFTADPVTGHRGTTVIDASPGLGEAVVSGAVNPDHFAVASATGLVLQRTPGDKRVRIRPAATGGTERVELPADPEPCLDDDQLAALTALGRRVHDHEGAAQDLEFAITADGTLWLTQARPITTLYPLPADAPPPESAEPRVYWSMNVAQGVLGPLTPMGIAVFRLIGSAAAALFGRPVADPYAGPTVLKIAGQRLYLDATTAIRSRVGRSVAPRVMGAMEARSEPLLRGLFDDPRLSVRHRSPAPVLHAVGPVLRRLHAPLRILGTVARPAAARKQLDRVERDNRAATDLPPELDARQRLARLADVIMDRFEPTLPGAIVGVMLPMIMLQGLARRLLRGVASVEEWQTTLRGLPDNPTTEMDLALWRLAEEFGRDPELRRLFADTSATDLARRYVEPCDAPLPEPVRAGLARFLETYGHRAVAEIDVGVPRWAEQPAHLINVLTGYLRLADRELAPDAVFGRAAAEAETMIDTLARRAGPVRGDLVRFLLRRIRRLAGLRERPKFNLVVLLAGIRSQLRLVGEDLVRQHRLDEAEDVFFVDLREAGTGLAGLDLRSLVRDRRAGYETEARRRHVPRLLLSDGTEPGVAAAETEGTLTGSPASPGTVTAPARVVLDPATARLEPGEILVAPSTDPGWTPLFLTAGGLVMEMGGAMSHGAVVAREYGIPAVVGVADATTRLDTGTRVTVDGSAGTVTPLEGC
ncbi:PEP/pyruvate-binding domain-containing protein [Microlunatus sp. GCM10028923]|uniref:PEP/pyruvate-binding domain-containing protein n=1 Tax=Microlunatus sp. GCM10028923 TaxID=3273400 RepID=UPI00361D5E64